METQKNVDLDYKKMGDEELENARSALIKAGSYLSRAYIDRHSGKNPHDPENVKRREKYVNRKINEIVKKSRLKFC